LIIGSDYFAPDNHRSIQNQLPAHILSETIIVVAPFRQTISAPANPDLISSLI